MGKTKIVNILYPWGKFPTELLDNVFTWLAQSSFPSRYTFTLKIRPVIITCSSILTWVGSTRSHSCQITTNTCSWRNKTQRTNLLQYWIWTGLVNRPRSPVDRLQDLQLQVCGFESLKLTADFTVNRINIGCCQLEVCNPLVGVCQVPVDGKII